MRTHYIQRKGVENMMYIIIKCVEDECSADINLYAVTNGTKYATMHANNRTIKFVAKPVSDYAGCHILTIQK